MSLYDDIDTDKNTTSGWASGIKLMHNQLAFKKAAVTAPKRDRKGTSKLPPVIDLKSRRDDDENIPPSIFFPKDHGTKHVQSTFSNTSDPEMKFNNEYDPLWPNDYEKFVKEMRDRRDKEEDDRRRSEREDRKRQRDRTEEPTSGFSKKHNPEEEHEEIDRPRRSGGGAAIAPPASLDDSMDSLPIMPSSIKSSAGFGGIGGSIAAKIMAKYGFKEGQGLGKSQQGIVRALEVEKTSKRGGRIVSEADEERFSPPPPQQFVMPPPLPAPNSPKPVAPANIQEGSDKNIADILRNPSKVALLRNMVGPGEVDDDLEPEVREECSGKYGNVTQVVIFEIPKAPDDEAVRIFVEFTRVEAAIKAIIDLNGRFFGGRQVKAGFYDYDNFKAYKLNEAP